VVTVAGGSESLGAQLKAHRKTEGWTQAQAAEAFNVSRRTYVGWELGQHAPHMSHAARIARRWPTVTTLEAFDAAATEAAEAAE
jgi:DNA-binding XRE family transcriptional regulator